MSNNEEDSTYEAQYGRDPNTLLAGLLERDRMIAILKVNIASLSGKTIMLDEVVKNLKLQIEEKDKLLSEYKQALLDHIHKLLK